MTKGCYVATTNDIKNGTVLNLDGQLWQVLWFQHHKPGKGNTVVRTKIKNVLNGKVVDRTFPADTKIEMAQVDRRDMQYLYDDPSGYVFMDTDNYEQLTIPADVIGDDKDYLLEGMIVTVATNEGTPLYIDLPASVELEVTYTGSRPAGRSLHRRQQARHRGDRQDRAGAAVHHHRREDQGQHRRRWLPRPRAELMSQPDDEIIPLAHGEHPRCPTR